MLIIKQVLLNGIIAARSPGSWGNGLKVLSATSDGRDRHKVIWTYGYRHLVAGIVHTAFGWSMAGNWNLLAGATEKFQKMMEL